MNTEQLRNYCETGINQCKLELQKDISDADRWMLEGRKDAFKEVSSAVSFFNLLGIYRVLNIASYIGHIINYAEDRLDIVTKPELCAYYTGNKLAFEEILKQIKEK